MIDFGLVAEPEISEIGGEPEIQKVTQTTTPSSVVTDTFTAVTDRTLTGTILYPQSFIRLNPTFYGTYA